MARQSKQHRRSVLHPNYHSSNYQLKNVTKCKLRPQNNIDNDDEENGEDMEPHFYYDENEFDEVFDHGGGGGNGANESHQPPPRYSLLQQQKQQQTTIRTHLFIRTHFRNNG